ncbi:MAG: hypothetical protein HY744_31710 [Deltaproteobacteria bacterium]|nr:hypothetical protein [Deltaproteobacteria bacterium]
MTREQDEFLELDRAAARLGRVRSPATAEDRAVARMLPALLLLVAAAAACIPAIPEPRRDDADRMETTEERLTQARQRYLDKCMACHEAISPARHPSGQWPKWVARMEPGAELKPEDKELILLYLEAFSAP